MLESWREACWRYMCLANVAVGSKRTTPTHPKRGKTSPRMVPGGKTSPRMVPCRMVPCIPKGKRTSEWAHVNLFLHTSNRTLSSFYEHVRNSVWVCKLVLIFWIPWRRGISSLLWCKNPKGNREVYQERYWHCWIAGWALIAWSDGCWSQACYLRVKMNWHLGCV